MVILLPTDVASLPQQLFHPCFGFLQFSICRKILFANFFRRYGFPFFFWGCPRVRTRYFQRNKNRVCRGHGGVACVPCFIFPKASWSVSNRSFPVLTVLRVSMTDASSAASYTSSSTGFSGRMHLMSTARTKRCTIDSSGGADSVFSIKFGAVLAKKKELG